MIVLDTNVLSEVMTPTGSETVKAWMDAQDAAALFVTAITEAEIRYGVRLLPDGKRKADLADATERLFGELFKERILAFDSAAAALYAEIAADRRAQGRPISTADAQIAAIARRHGASIATRNIADFENCGLTILNPWGG